MKHLIDFNFLDVHNTGESLEQIHSRIKQKQALCSWEELEYSHEKKNLDMF